MERRVLPCLFFSGVLLITGCTGGFGSNVSNVSNASPASGTSSVIAVNVSCNPTTVTPGQTSQCTANVTGTGSYSTDVVWAAGAGTITSSGLYTAPTAAPSSGIDTVTATSKQDNKKSGNNSVKVTGQSQNSSISTVSVTANPASIILGQTSICSANVSGKGNFSTAVTWTATGGTITESGVFTPFAAGTGSCTATSTQDSTQSASASIITTAAASAQIQVTVTGVSVAASPASISTSQTATCVANVTGTGAYSTGVTWTATGGTITQGGVFTPSGTGTGSCKATSTQAGFTNVSGSASIAITNATPTVTNVAVAANPATITTGQTATCVANVTGTGAYGTGVTWTATGGTITQGGVFTPSGTGTGSCKATSTQAGYTSVSGQAAINVTSSGTATLSVNATTIAFGTVNLNTSATQTITLTSTGTTAVTISAASVTGTGFSISGATFPLTLNLNQSASLFVVFDPTVAGSATGRLTISSNSSSGATTAVSLTGTGQLVHHQVNLSWNAPADSAGPVAGYNVFRAPTGSTSYQQLNTSAVTATNYVDGNVQNGTTYDYVVRSVDASSGSSGPSNTATVVIPQ